VGGKPRTKARAFIGLGSNLGDRMSLLRSAVAGLPDVVRVSGIYETEPVGGPDGQDRYLNVVVELSTDLTPEELLESARNLEGQAGRLRTVRFGPRTLDVDILLVGEESVDTEDLVVPHPRMWERRFVVAPLAEIAPEVVAAHAVETAGGEVQRTVDWT
jgi:2-amino-4-hydroxy-6-hydroxymethyldihydropteridine diphosphokinase